MESLIIKIEKELKKKFQIKVIQNDQSMTDVLVDLIKKYVDVLVLPLPVGITNMPFLIFCVTK